MNDKYNRYDEASKKVKSDESAPGDVGRCRVSITHTPVAYDVGTIE